MKTKRKKQLPIKESKRAMTEMLPHNLEIYFLENPLEAEQNCGTGINQ